MQQAKLHDQLDHHIHRNLEPNVSRAKMLKRFIEESDDFSQLK